ncbi:MAG: substrate-binding domain-containing protein, partial [Pseudomonadota bacterium]
WLPKRFGKIWMNLKELSDLLGLSQTTVSRALNGYPEVSEATRLRVAKAADDHNYRPNNLARGLATGRAMAIGHVIPQTSTHEMVNPIFGDFIGGAGETYSANNYDMLLSLVPDVDEAQAYRQMAAKASVDGLILHGPKTNDDRIALVRSLGVPFVVHGRASGITLPYHWVDVNNRRAFERATDFLIQLGHRDIALLNGIETMDFAQRRRAGFEAAMQAADIPVRHDLMFSSEMTELYGYKIAMNLLDQPNRPTAFMVASLVSGMGVRRALEDKGMKMGRDASIVIHDDDLSYMPNGDTVPMFTATKSSVREAGRLAAKMLLNVIADPTLPTQELMLEAQLVVGQSTGPART